jgi:heme exporter protein B
VILRVAGAVAAKDLRVELRSRSALGSVLPFAATMLLALGFSLGPGRALLEQSAPGLLWLAGLFASVVGKRIATQDRRRHAPAR